VAPADDYKDRLTGKTILKVTTEQIYWGAVPFVLIQIVMVSLIIAFPNLVSGGLAAKKALDVSNQVIDVQPAEEKKEVDLNDLFATPPASGASK
jgi:GntP family gluconate:H+ symporter